MEQLDCELELVKNDDAIPPLSNYDGIVLSPGPGLPEEAKNLNRYIALSDSSIPVFGVCLGLQAIGVYLGAELYNQPEVKHGIQEKIQVLGGVLYDRAGLREVGLYHSWALNTSGDFQVSATSVSGVVMAIENRERKLFGVQYHPESILSSGGMEVLKNFITFCSQNKRR